jgi:hypothetical protein
MARPASDLRNDLRALQASNAELKTELAALRALVVPAKLAPVVDPTAPVLAGGVWVEPGTSLMRNKNGTPHRANADLRDFTTRRLEAVAIHEAEQKAELAAMSAGLPPGQWRSPDGLIRDRHGKVVPAPVAELGPQDRATENSAPSPNPVPVETTKMPLTHQEQIDAANVADMLHLRAIDKADQARRAATADTVKTAAPATEPEPVSDVRDGIQVDQAPDRVLSLAELLEPKAA